MERKDSYLEMFQKRVYRNKLTLVRHHLGHRRRIAGRPTIHHPVVLQEEATLVQVDGSECVKGDGSF